jgi:hypothetical protein
MTGDLENRAFARPRVNERRGERSRIPRYIGSIYLVYAVPVVEHTVTTTDEFRLPIAKGRC